MVRGCTRPVPVRVEVTSEQHCDERRRKGAGNLLIKLPRWAGWYRPPPPRMDRSVQRHPCRAKHLPSHVHGAERPIPPCQRVPDQPPQSSQTLESLRKTAASSEPPTEEAAFSCSKAVAAGKYHPDSGLLGGRQPDCLQQLARQAGITRIQAGRECAAASIGALPRCLFHNPERTWSCRTCQHSSR